MTKQTTTATATRTQRVLTPEMAEFLRQFREAQTGPDEHGEVMEMASGNRNPRRRRREAVETTVGVLIEPAANITFDRLILHPEVERDVTAALRAISRRELLDEVWGIGEIQSQKGRCILNFFGPAGTGKTQCAKAIANKLNRPLYWVDYSAIISKYLGDTAKHITKAFQEASDAGAILMFDEADSLLSKRVSSGESCSTSINQNRNVMAQCLDQFDGIVICTTNLFDNFDEMMVRRIQRHIEFRLPDEAMRRKLFDLHLPKKTCVSANLTEVAKESKGLSGGDILNACVNAMHSASVNDDPATWELTTSILLDEIDAVMVAKRKHGGAKAARPSIGFHA